VSIEFDSAKDRHNRRRHGISLARAAELFEAPYREAEDLRFDYDERRFIAFGWIEGRLFACVYTWRGLNRRIISLRRATRKETDAYYQADQN
jgi:hypothetical protein